MASDEEKDIEIPGEGDENVGNGEIKKKRERRHKSKEERKAERRVVFWTLLIILIITLGFWLAPKVGNIIQNGLPKIWVEKKDGVKENVEKPEKKNYVEITL